ncbi:MAG: tryptophan-rich sensory protein [Oscillospiraceae bacterium]|nr:tryptophan-rich sensory protein [Oscillospiraceae bacterium]
MKRRKWKAYAFWIALPEIVGAVSGLLTRTGTKRYAELLVKPPLSPPGVVFPIVWAILYALMGVGAARVWLTPVSGPRRRAIALFFVQLAFNFFWSIIFFGAQSYLGALVWLIVMWIFILSMTLSFRRLDRPAAYLQIPYLVWVAFAGYLNAGVWLLNR